MDTETFKFICDLVRPGLQREGTNYRDSLTVEHIVAMGLYKLAHSVRYNSMQHLFGVGGSTAQNACVDFNRAIWAHKKEFIGWRDKTKTLEAFRNKGFPGCLGAIDGCHIPIARPHGVGATYKSYKGFHSIVLQGVVDENMRFCSVDIGNPGRNHDAQTYRTSKFFQEAESNFGFSSDFTIKVTVGGRAHKVKPYVLGDPAYPLSRWLIKGYPGSKVSESKEFAYFTYRQSSARMKVEQAFGILKVRWQRLGNAHQAHIRNHVEAVGAACVLHNICIDRMGRTGLAQDSAILREDPEPMDFAEIREPQGSYIETDVRDGENEDFSHSRAVREAGEKTRKILTKLLIQDRRYDNWEWVDVRGH